MVDPSPLCARDGLRATGSRVTDTAIGRPTPRFPNFCTATITGIDPPFPNEPLERCFVALAVLGLKRTRIPVEPEPFEVALQFVDVARFSPLAIEIFESKDDPSSARACVQPTQQAGNQRARMDATGRRRCETANFETWLQFFNHPRMNPDSASLRRSKFPHRKRTLYRRREYARDAASE